MGAFGQVYLEYNSGTVDIKGGRQLFESVFTASQMIPNIFDGLMVAAKITDENHREIRSPK